MMNAEQAKALLSSITPGPWEIDGIAIAGNDKRAGDVCYMGVGAQYAGDTARMLNNCDANASAIAALPDALATVVADAEEKARMAARIEALEAEKAELRETVLREAATICKRMRNENKYDLSEEGLVGVLECALALTDEANRARAALAQGER